MNAFLSLLFAVCLLVSPVVTALAFGADPATPTYRIE